MFGRLNNSTYSLLSFTMQHESRKRPHADSTDDLLSSKKRVIASSSLELNGAHHNSDEPTLDNLEVLRFIYSTFHLVSS